MMLSLRPEEGLHPPIMRTVASTGKGVPELHAELERRLDTQDSEAWGRRMLKRARTQVEEILREQATVTLLEQMGDELEPLLGQVARREIDPYSLVERIMARGLCASRGGAAPS
jgi:LAO/AO transport system kinase